MSESGRKKCNKNYYFSFICSVVFYTSAIYIRQLGSEPMKENKIRCATTMNVAPQPFKVALFCLLSMASLDAITQTDFDDEDELLDLYGDVQSISIATGAKQSIAKAPAVASVITAKQIREMGATDIDQVLESVPGLHVKVSSSGYNPIYIFRGITSEFNPQVLMLINGIPISNLFQGDRNQIWGGMPVNAISRIEIIRGPGSAVYGADAFAGVINIITKTREDIKENEIGARLGSFDSRDLWTALAGDWGTAEVAFILEYHNTDGHREIIDEDAQTGLDAAFGTNASLAPGPVNLSRDNIDIRFDLKWQNVRFRSGLQRREDWGNGAGVAQALDPNNRFKSDRFNLDISYDATEFSENWDISFLFSYFDTTQEVTEDLILFPPGANIGFGVFPEGVIGNPNVFERHYRFNTSIFYHGIDRHQIRIGAGYYLGDVHRIEETKNFGIDPNSSPPTPLPPGADIVDVTDTPFVFLPEIDRENTYVFIQDVWKIYNDWELTAGVRHDSYSDFSDTTNPRLSLVWSTTLNLTTKLLYSEAFRAPAFAESQVINNPVVIGNPDLEPETIRSIELAFNYRSSEKLTWGVNLFDYEWEDVIQFVPEEGESFAVAQNLGEQTGQGIELETQWQANDNLVLNANFAIQNSEDEEVGADADDVPRRQIYLGSNWKFYPSWSMHTEIHGVFDRLRNPNDARTSIEDYQLVNMNIRKVSEQQNWQVSLSINNIFDEDAREPTPWENPVAQIPNDLPLAGRNATLEFIYSF